jgi:hypothetical protein
MLTVLGFGLGATFRDADSLFLQPALLLRCVLSMMVVMPLIVIAVVLLLDLPFEVKVALVAISISPVPPILQKNQISAGGPLDSSPACWSRCRRWRSCSCRCGSGSSIRCSPATPTCARWPSPRSC